MFRPLVEEFYNVLEAAGVLCGGSVEECSVFSVQCSASGEQRGSGCRLRAAGTAPAGAHYEIRVTCSVVETGRVEAAVECEEQEGEKGRKGEREKDTQQDITWTALFDALPFSPSPPTRCAGAPPFSPSSDPPLPFSPASGRPLIALPRKTFRTANLDRDAARRWCSDLLKKCAAACMEANRR